MLIDSKPKQEKADGPPLLSLSAFSIQGKRNHMEDYFDIGYQMKACDQQHPNQWPYEYFYFGIFDGHGGSEASDFAKQNLLKFITKQKDFWSDKDEDVMRAIRLGYAETHSAMRKAMAEWPRNAKVLPSTAGTTASVLFIKNGKFYSGHVGDSRIVVCQEKNDGYSPLWIPEEVTKDHKPEYLNEELRIQRAGGAVKRKLGVDRVVWMRPVLHSVPEPKPIRESDPAESAKYDQFIKSIPTYPVPESMVSYYQSVPFLAIARSLGDFWSLNPYSGLYIVSPEPDVTCRPIKPNDKCIILATDGLWNVLDSFLASKIVQELDIVKRRERHHYSHFYFATDNFYDVSGYESDDHARSLVYIAYQIWERRRLRSDNITAVVVMLHKILANYQNYERSHPNCATVQQNMELNLDQLKLNDNPTQLGKTTHFKDIIRIDQEPNFIIPEQECDDEKAQKLESFLVLPPTIIEKEYCYLYPELIYPRNYMKLSMAPCRKIPRNDSYTDSYIYIKRVSDDPADEMRRPTRINKSGKEVCDASAQATQSIHDFGQPWDQLLKSENDDDVKSNNDMINVGEEEDSDDSHDDEEVHDEEEELVFASELIQSHGESLDNFELELDVDDLKVKEKPKKKERSIPQLRCLLNYTPPLRRSARNRYRSMSDNGKRKIQNTSNAPSLAKSKRRKSQPIRCNLSRT